MIARPLGIAFFFLPGLGAFSVRERAARQGRKEPKDGKTRRRPPAAQAPLQGGQGTAQGGLTQVRIVS